MTTVDKLVEVNPFPGLRAFATSEADRFFGRRRQIKELASKLDDVGFIAVAGSSGCGKSSLVLAGLLSELSSDCKAENKTIWQAVVMQPGNQPMANLAQQLSTVIGGGGDDASRAGALCGQFRLGGLGLVEAVRLARLNARTRVLIVVDQFEELFRFRRMTDADEAMAFVRLLLHAANDQQSPVSVVITLRSDTLGYCDDFHDLPETVSRGQYLVPRLTREQRKEAITGPVKLRGFDIAPRLVQRLLNDVSDDFDDLPVMQHVLARTWNRWAQESEGSRPIDLEDYEAVGTSKNALARHADEAFESLAQLAPVTEKVFRALTECLADGAEVRRALPYDLLCQVVGTSREQVAQIVERFRQPDTAFLRPGQAIPLTSNPVIDISHESLIRQWPRLREWAQAEAKSRETLERLIHAATRRIEPNPGSLWRDRELEEALEWQRDTNPTPAWVKLHVKGDGAENLKSAEAFLAESTHDVNLKRWRKKLLISGTGLIVLAAVIASVYWMAYTLKVAKSNAHASEALRTIDQDPARSAHLALVALENNSNNQLGVYALRQSLAALEVAYTESIIPLGEPVSDAGFTRDGSLLITASGKTVKIFDSKDFNQKWAYTREQNVMRAWLIDNNSLLVTHTEDGEVQIQKIDGSALHVIGCQGENDPFIIVANMGPDNRHVALGCSDGTVSVWDATDFRAGPKHTYKHKDDRPVTALAFSSDEKYLASGDAFGTVNMWKLGFQRVWISLNVHRGEKSPINHVWQYAIRDMTFHRDDPALLLAAYDKNAVVWELDLERRRLKRNERKEPLRRPLSHERPVIAANFTAHRDGIPIITVSGKNTQLWQNGVVSKGLSAHDDWVLNANASSDGEMLATASSDGTARIWSTRSGTPIAILRGHRGMVTLAAFSPEGNQVITAGTDETVRIWRFRPPHLLTSSNHWAFSATFSPDRSRIAVGEEGQAFILQLAGGIKNLPLSREDLQVGEVGAIEEMSWSRDGKYLIGLDALTTSFGVETRPILWDAESKQDISPRWFRDLTDAVFSPGTDELLTINRTGRIAVWNMTSLDTDDPQATYTIDEEKDLFRAAMSPDGHWIAASKGNRGKVWKRDGTQTPIREIQHAGDILSLQFSRDSSRLLTASSDRTAKIWPIDASDSPKELKGGHRARLVTATFSADGKRVLTASADNTIGVWDSEAPELLASLQWHNEAVNSVEFSDDGTWILSASDDGAVKFDPCETCILTSEKLQKRVSKLAKLSEHEMKEIHADSATVTGLFHLPALFSRTH